MDRKEIGFSCVEGIELDQETVQWCNSGYV